MSLEVFIKDTQCVTQESFFPGVIHTLQTFTRDIARLENSLRKWIWGDKTKVNDETGTIGKEKMNATFTI